MAEEEQDAQICQMAINDLSQRLSIKFPGYPQLASKFITLCKEEAFEDIDILLEDVADGFDESVILDGLAADISVQEEDKEPICAFMHHTLSNFSSTPNSFDLADLSVL
eukprot:226955_1